MENRSCVATPKRLVPESGRGDFDLDLDQARARDVVHLKSGTGNATVLLPKLSEVDVRAQSPWKAF